MSETHESINAWQVEIFGPPPEPLRIAGRLYEEVAELVRAATAGRYGDLADKAAECKIVLYRLAESIGENLDTTMGITMHDPMRFCDTIVVLGHVDRVQEAASRLLTVFLRDHMDDGGPRAVIRCMGLRLQEICDYLRVSLDEEVDRKMAVNRARQWEVGADGGTHHVGA